ncbi:ABC transporter ATP-binding protein [Geobacillus stearothermophilus]|nr:ABC transporter [Geobacillus lituanicus]QHN48395.1 ABC transporter ATP-binding protein [Geobacillus stearothermophilus]
MNYIELHNIAKSFDNKNYILKDINLSLHQGDRVGIIGGIGSGKTTLLRIILGLYTPTSGKINRNISNHEIGYLPSTKGIIEEFTVRENLIFWSQTYQSPIHVVEELIDRLNMDKMADKKVSLLSSGMKQKLAFACSIIHSPKLLILDEPTVNLDVENRSLIKKFIQEYPKESCIVITSHNFDDIEHMCNRIVMIVDGTIKVKEELNKLKSDFQSSLVRIRTISKINRQQSILIKEEFPNVLVKDHEVILDKQIYKLNDVLLKLIHLNIEIRDVLENEAILEDIYLRLNKKEG